MLIIKDATVSTGHDNDTGVFHMLVDGGKIVDIIADGSQIPQCDDVIEAKGLMLLPGAVDSHVHFDTPGYTDREDFTHGSMAAAAGGVTCVADMPDTCVPTVTDRSKLNAKLKVISDMSVIDFALWGGISGNSFRERDWQKNVKGLKDGGVIGFKSYLVSGMATFEHLFPIELVDVMRCVAEVGSLIGLHAEDRDFVLKKSAALKTAGRFDQKAYYESRCDPAEIDGIRQGIEIAGATACPLHIVHVGSAKGAEEAIKARKNRGIDVTLETCAHFLAFSFEDLIEKGSVLQTAPVIKTKKDSEELWRLLANGGINFISSDHASCTVAEKNTGSVWTDDAGIPGTELMFPYIFSDGYKKGILSLARLIEITSVAAAKRYGLYPRKGSIERGSDADFILVDPDRRWTVCGADLHSKGKFTPFEGREFIGKIVKTICRGATVFDEKSGICVSPGYGQFIKRGG